MAKIRQDFPLLCQTIKERIFESCSLTYSRTRVLADAKIAVPVSQYCEGGTCALGEVLGLNVEALACK